MLIQKGGIFRQIDEHNLAKYKEKGYSQVEATATATPEPDPKAGTKDDKVSK